MQYRNPFIPIRFAFCAACLTCAGFFHVPLFAEAEAQQLLLKVKEADSQRDASVTSVVSKRRYVLRNEKWDKDAEMEVHITSSPGKPKHYEIVRMENAEGLQKRVFQKLLDGEVAASRSESKDDDSEITSYNYDFTVLGRENVKGRDCIVLELKPKRNSKLLLNGKAWIDPKENAIVRVQGRTARNISFWIGRPEITHDFRKVQDVWLLSHNQSVSKVRFLGKTELTIHFFDYELHRRNTFAAKHPPVGIQ